MKISNIPALPAMSADRPAGRQYSISNIGFTVIELLVVIAIMAIIVGLVIIDFAGQKPGRDLRIAQNELVTNIRKAQSYSLFSKNVNNVKPAQYYLLKFSAAMPDRYYIQAITDATSAPKLNSMETVLLPKNIIFSQTSPFVIDRPAGLTDPSVPPTCVLVAFKAPFGRAYVNDGCNITNPGFQSGDDYKKILDFVQNINGLSVSADTDLVITFNFKDGTQSKKVLIKGVTGLVCPTVDGTTCSF